MSSVVPFLYEHIHIPIRVYTCMHTYHIDSGSMPRRVMYVFCKLHLCSLSHICISMPTCICNYVLCPWLRLFGASVD